MDTDGYGPGAQPSAHTPPTAPTTPATPREPEEAERAVRRAELLHERALAAARRRRRGVVLRSPSSLPLGAATVPLARVQLLDPEDADA